MTCRGCQIKEEAVNADVSAIVAEMLALEPLHLSKKEAQTRVSICQECFYHSRHTCIKCGCYYEFRAYLPQKDCPMGYWPKLVANQGDYQNETRY